MKRDNINYTLVGLVVLAALGTLLVVLFLITGRGGGSVSYFTEYRNVTGLGFGAPVFYEGFRIGQVDDIQPLREGGRTRYRVELAVRRDWPVPDDAVAKLSSSGLLADVAIAIREGESQVLLKPGALLKAEEGQDVFGAVNDLAAEVTVLTRDRLRPLVDKLGQRVDSIASSLDERTPALLAEAEALLKRLNTASESVNRILSTKNRELIDATLSDLAGTASNARQVSGELDRTRAQFDALLAELNGTVAENRPDIREAVVDLRQITASLARRIDAISHNLESSSRNLNEFTREVRKSPNRLLFTPKADTVIVEEDE
jgi:phospholipid/cholesterol/gamma-HCH transport system substrate-binding protein